MNRLSLSVITLVGLLTACQSADRSHIKAHGPVPADSLQPSVETVRTSTLTPPVTFAGDIPCADCPGQRVVISLRSDGIFLLRRTYVGVEAGKDKQVHDLGRWVLSQDGTRLILQASSETPLQFAIKSRSVLRMLTNEGDEIQSRLNYELVRSDAYDPIEVRMPLRGMFSYLADSPSLTECVTGHRFPVAQEEDYVAAERAYMTLRWAPGEPILIEIEGRLTRRPMGERGALTEAIVVDHFDRIRPGETCARQAMSKASLTNTYWRPVEIGGRSVTVAAGGREPHLTLVPQNNLLRGFGGCNQMQGRYEVQGQGNELRFIGTAATRMYCQETMEQEQALFQALEGTANYKLIGETLELYDVTGRLLARFESRYLK